MITTALCDRGDFHTKSLLKKWEEMSKAKRWFSKFLQYFSKQPQSTSSTVKDEYKSSSNIQTEQIFNAFDKIQIYTLHPRNEHNMNSHTMNIPSLPVSPRKQISANVIIIISQSNLHVLACLRMNQITYCYLSPDFNYSVLQSIIILHYCNTHSLRKLTRFVRTAEISWSEVGPSSPCLLFLQRLSGWSV